MYKRQIQHRVPAQAVVEPGTLETQFVVFQLVRVVTSRQYRRCPHGVRATPAETLRVGDVAHHVVIELIGDVEFGHPVRVAGAGTLVIGEVVGFQVRCLAAER